jgi:GTP-binding protein
MPFTDRVQINVEGGHGGNGCMSFRREPKVPKGGPDGGNGGRGGGVVLVADPRVTDLSRFRHAVHHRAANGGHGEGKARHGRSGDDLLVEVPPGTRVLRDGHVIAELAAPGDQVPVARGGGGGGGNRACRSSTRQAPRNTTPGAAGEEAWLTLELRLPVDVGIVGLPNAGKSALLVALTGAAATVAPYPQSTREPAFGPLEDEDANLYLVADLPGLAVDGTARRDAHLEQLERARVVLHAVDAADPTPAGDRIAAAREGIAPYLGEGAEEIVVATRADEGEPVEEADVAVDTVTGRGVDALRDRVIAALREA